MNPDYSTRIGLNTHLKIYAQNVYATATQPAMKKYHSVYCILINAYYECIHSYTENEKF